MSEPDGENTPGPPPDRSAVGPSGYAIVAGFGVPGRNCAEWLTRHRWAFTVIERNEQTVARCGKVGVPIVNGDATDPDTLRRAGIDRADLISVTIPDEQVALAVVTLARQMNPSVRILCRVYHVSVAFEAARRGADQTIVAEELAAREFVRLLDGGRGAFAPSDGRKPAGGSGERPTSNAQR